MKKLSLPEFKSAIEHLTVKIVTIWTIESVVTVMPVVMVVTESKKIVEKRF